MLGVLFSTGAFSGSTSAFPFTKIFFLLKITEFPAGGGVGVREHGLPAAGPSAELRSFEARDNRFLA